MATTAATPPTLAAKLDAWLARQPDPPPAVRRWVRTLQRSNIGGHIAGPGSVTIAETLAVTFLEGYAADYHDGWRSREQQR